MLEILFSVWGLKKNLTYFISSKFLWACRTLKIKLYSQVPKMQQWHIILWSTQAWDLFLHCEPGKDDTYFPEQKLLWKWNRSDIQIALLAWRMTSESSQSQMQQNSHLLKRSEQQERLFYKKLFSQVLWKSITFFPSGIPCSYFCYYCICHFLFWCKQRRS